ncbi:MAG: hypothetical protein OXT67_10615 [Zetaproteobacteria bacterium]|nr:hypothetical protein [Zetaproteobacteria bacterium]
MRNFVCLVLMLCWRWSAVYAQEPTRVQAWEQGNACQNEWRLRDSRVFSRLEGSWKGTWTRYDAQGLPQPYVIDGKAVRVKTSVLTQRIDDVKNIWLQSNFYPQLDFTRHFLGTVTGPGQVSYANREGEGYDDYDAVATEYDDYHILFVVKHKQSGKVIYTEDISLITVDERTRVGRRYHPDTGAFLGVTVVRELRVM